MPSIVEKPFSGSVPVPRLCRRDPSPGVPSLVAVARFELAVRPPARPRPGLRVNGRCHSPTSAIAKSTSTPASDPSLHRSEPVTGSFRCAPRVAPRSARRRRGKRNRSSAGTEAPPRRPRARRVSVRAAADRPARRASDTSLVTAAPDPRRWRRRGASRFGLGLPHARPPRRVRAFERPRCLPLPGKPTLPLGLRRFARRRLGAPKGSLLSGVHAFVAGRCSSP
jgi:hypothetical protein